MATQTQDLGLVTAYGYAKAGGYTGTEAQFKALLAGVETYYNGSQTAASNAAASAAEAKRSADNAFSGTPAGYDKVANIANSNNISGVSNRAGWITLQAGADLNSIIQPGVYAASSTSAQGIDNCPTTQAFKMTVEVTYNSNNHFRQRLAESNNQAKSWHRWTSDGSTWSDWMPEYDLAGSIAELGSDTALISKPSGFYMLGASAEDLSAGYIPNRYGTLLVQRTGENYMSAMLLTTNGKAYFRVGNASNNTWYTNWIQLQTVS